jgi:hypothetical protein
MAVSAGVDWTLRRVVVLVDTRQWYSRILQAQSPGILGRTHPIGDGSRWFLFDHVAKRSSS